MVTVFSSSKNRKLKCKKLKIEERSMRPDVRKNQTMKICLSAKAKLQIRNEVRISDF